MCIRGGNKSVFHELGRSVRLLREGDADGQSEEKRMSGWLYGSWISLSQRRSRDMRATLVVQRGRGKTKKENYNMSTLNYSSVIRRIIWFIIFSGRVAFGQHDRPDYIFLFIGDGMGEPHVCVAEQYVRDSQIQRGVDPGQVKGLVMTSLPVRGSVSTDNRSGGVTDSAASATAFSTGVKVANGEINYDSSAGRILEPLDSFCRRNGYRVGIISSSAPNHATPAGFYAVVQGRNSFPEIAHQLVNSGLDYVGGPFLMRAGTSDSALIDAAVSNGFTVAGSRAAFNALVPGTGRVWAYSQMGMVIDGPHSITLADHTRKAVELLEPSGRFFIMVEGAQIDWAGHANDGASMVFETMAFDEAVGAAFEFYSREPDKTLILVTSDHETGGLSLDLDKLSAPGMSRIVRAQKGSRSKAEAIFRQIENKKLRFDEALPLMKQFFGTENLSDQEAESLRAAFNEGGEVKGDFSYGDNKKMALAWVRLVSARAGMVWSSLNHTADRVPLYAVGVQVQRFGGDSDNALIGRRLRALMAGEE